MFKSTFTEKSNAELISMLLGVPEFNLKMHELSDIVQAPRSIEGVGEKKEAKLYALQEVTRRLMAQNSRQRDAIHGPEDAAHILMPKFRYELKEHFAVMLLDTKNHVLAIPTVSIGSLSASIVHPREVFTEILKYPTASVILAHNHPSGDPSPSREDISVTERLIKCGKVMDIPVLDHIIIRKQINRGPPCHRVFIIYVNVRLRRRAIQISSQMLVLSTATLLARNCRCIRIKTNRICARRLFLFLWAYPRFFNLAA